MLFKLATHGLPVCLARCRLRTCWFPHRPPDSKHHRHHADISHKVHWEQRPCIPACASTVARWAWKGRNTRADQGARPRHGGQDEGNEQRGSAKRLIKQELERSGPSPLS